MKTIKREDLKKKVIQGKADYKSLSKPKTEPPKDDSLKKLQGTIEQVLAQLPKALLETALATENNTKATMSMVEFIKRQKEREQPIEIKIEGATEWDFELHRDGRNLLKNIKAIRKDGNR